MNTVLMTERKLNKGNHKMNCSRRKEAAGSGKELNPVSKVINLVKILNGIKGVVSTGLDLT